MKVIKYDLTSSDSFHGHNYDTKQHSSPTLQSTDTIPGIHVSTVIRVHDKSYTAQKIPKYGMSLVDSAGWQMLTCFDVKGKEVTAELVQGLREEYDSTDDVFCHSFLQNILLQTNDGHVSDSVIELLQSWKCLCVYLIPEKCAISPGPYLFSASGIFWVWRLFVDQQDAFVMSTIPSQQDTSVYESLSAAASEASSLTIAVPSRLYFQRTQELPFAGLRISVKDVFHLKGVRTTAGNRAFFRLYAPRTSTSAAVQRAIDLGAIIVGKAKTAEFAGSQEVIGDWCDYSYPFNVRADGYMTSTGSSTGSASGLAAYPWLDLSIGSDAGGSIRDPSVVHGIYGFRPSHDGSATEDAVIPCPIFQVPGFMGRSSGAMLDFGNIWLSTNAISKGGKPWRLWFPPEYYADRPDVQSVAEDVITRLAKWLKAEVDRTPIEEVWKDSKPSGISKSFQEYFGKTFMDVLAHEYWQYTSTFREDYQKKFDVEPYVCKITEWLWSKGISTSPERKSEALAEVHTHNKWLESIFHSNTLLVCPMYRLSHRDEYLGPPESRHYYGFDVNLHASMAGLPNIIVPVGQCTDFSTVMRKEVEFPVSMSITGAKHTDVDLLKLVDEFIGTTDIPSTVATGSQAFPVS